MKPLKSKHKEAVVSKEAVRRQLEKEAEEAIKSANMHGTVAVIPPEVTELQNRAERIIRDTGNLAVSYFELVSHIRQHSMAPKLVSEELGKLGFSRQRVSEINKVAQASDETFSAYASKLLGFRGALQLARVEADGKVVATAAADMLSLTDEEKAAGVAAEHTEAAQAESANSTKEPVKPAVKAAALASQLFKLAGDLRKRVWESGDGWKLEMVRVKAGKGSK